MRQYCPSGGTVVDFFAGTMKTAHASLRHGNIGYFCEKDVECYDAAVGRVEKFFAIHLEKNIIKIEKVYSLLPRCLCTYRPMF